MIRLVSAIVGLCYALHCAGAAVPLVVYGVDRAFGDGCCGVGVCLCASAPGDCQCGEPAASSDSCCSAETSACCDVATTDVDDDSCCGESSAIPESCFSVPVCGGHKTIGVASVPPHLSTPAETMPERLPATSAHSEQAQLQPLHKPAKIGKVPIAT